MATPKIECLEHSRNDSWNCIRYSIKECAKPVIAAVNGPAMGAGYALMVFCDIMLASDNAFVSMPEIDVGLSGGARMLLELSIPILSEEGMDAIAIAIADRVVRPEQQPPRRFAPPLLSRRGNTTILGACRTYDRQAP